jgi:hypothetical protein
VLKVRKNVRGLWSAIGYANSHDENVLFRISLDFVVVEVSPREGGGGRVWCKTALVPNQELFLNPTQPTCTRLQQRRIYCAITRSIDEDQLYYIQVSEHTSEVWVAIVVGECILARASS